MFDETQQFIVLLDIEETLIHAWNDPQWINTGNIVKKFLHGEWTPHPVPMQCRLGLMSWAVYDDADKAIFERDIRPMLEERLQFKFDDDLIFSMDDWAGMVFEASRCRVTRNDLFDVCKKEDVLFKMRGHHLFEHTTTWLIDDAVGKMDVIESIDNRSRFIIRNVHNLFED